MNRFNLLCGRAATAALVLATLWYYPAAEGAGSALAGQEASRGTSLTDLRHLKENGERAIPPYEILMTADTIARFDGIFPMPKWSPPGAQGNATRNVAVFSVISWTSYEKPGKYGDGRSPQFMVDMEKTPFCQYADALSDIAALKPGDTVRLCWMHIYVDDKGVRSPERPVTLLQAAEAPEGKPMPPPYMPPPLDRMPRPLMRTE